MSDAKTEMFRARERGREASIVSLQEGAKLDQGKPRISLIPTEAIMEMAKAFTYGADKYEADNFKKGINHRRLLDAAMRHLLAVSSGEYIDPESGNSHLGHALASIAMLVYMQKYKPEFNDIYGEVAAPKGDK